jgi:hypothetical protein
MAASLAAGDVSLSRSIANQLVATAEDEIKNSQLPTTEMMLPWLKAEDRMRVINAASIEWKQLSKDDFQFLKAATVVDDLAIAGWLLENVAKSELNLKQSGQVRPYLLRALVGPAADSISTWVYPSQPGMSYASSTPVAGKKRAIAWLHTQYMATQNDAIRALLFRSLSFLDHDLAVQSAVGFVAQATEPSGCLDVALTLSLVDEYAKSADRAVQWLSHPVADVRAKAIQYLCRTPNSYSQFERSGSDLVTVYQQDEHLPGLWYTQRDIPFDAIQSFVEANEEKSGLARVLLLASKKPPSIEDVAMKLDGKDAAILACVALSLAERTDAEALAFYEKVSESLAAEDEFASPLYVILRDLKSPEIRTLRSNLRKKHGSAILNP